MDIKNLLNLCCSPNKETTIINDEFYFSNNMSNKETKEKNQEENIDFTFYAKNQNNDYNLQNTGPQNSKNGEIDINRIIENTTQTKNENTLEGQQKPFRRSIPQITLIENISVGLEKAVGKKSEDFFDLKEKEKVKNSVMNINTGNDNSFKVSLPSAKITFNNNESSIINNKSVYSPDNTFSEIKKEKIDINKRIDESSYIDNIVSNRVITEDDIKKAKIIMLEEIEGNLLKKQTLVINASGLMNGERNAKDGIVFFGTRLKKNDSIINDYMLNAENDDNSIHTFIIYYKKDVNKYFLKSYKEKDFSALALVLVKIEENIIIKKKQIIKIGENYFQICPLPNEEIEIIRLEAKNQEKLYYRFFQSESPITVGRNKKCKISFPDDKSFSRIQTTIYFENGNWYLKDGYDKSSTNGTWLYAQNSYELQHDTIFRVYNSSIRISIKENAIYSFLKHVNPEK